MPSSPLHMDTPPLSPSRCTHAASCCPPRKDLERDFALLENFLDRKTRPAYLDYEDEELLRGGNPPHCSSACKFERLNPVRGMEDVYVCTRHFRVHVSFLLATPIFSKQSTHSTMHRRNAACTAACAFNRVKTLRALTRARCCR